MKDTSKIILALLAALFGFLALFYGIKYNQAKNTSQTYLIEKEEVNEEYDKLVSEFEIISNELDSMIISRREALSTLDEKTTELENMQAEISRLLRQDRLSRNELDQARQMIDELRVEKDNLLAQISTLNTENASLREENTNYSRTLTIVSQEKDSIENEKSTLEQQNEALEEERNELVEEREANADKVEFSQVIPVKNIVAEGIKYKNSGREKETSNYKRVDKLAITFTIAKNPVAEDGPKEYLIRVIYPDGTIAYDRQRGSGEFVSAEEEGMKFTTKTAINYQQEEKQVSVFWRQDIPFQKGDYMVEVYQSGYKVGEGRFELRGGL